MCSILVLTKLHLLQQQALFFGQVFAELEEEVRQLLPPEIIREKIPQIGGVLLQQPDGVTEAVDLEFLQMVGHEVGGNIHAVQHVADIVEHAGGHVGHAGLAGDDEHFLVSLLRLPLHPCPFLHFGLEALGRLPQFVVHLSQFRCLFPHPGFQLQPGSFTDRLRPHAFPQEDLQLHHAREQQQGDHTENDVDLDAELEAGLKKKHAQQRQN